MPRISLIDGVAMFVVASSILKMLEMAYHKRLVDRGVTDAWQRLPITSVIGRVPVLHWLLFRLPTLIVSLSVLGFSVQHGVVRWTVASMIALILWFLIGRMMYDLLHAGTNRHLSSLGAPNFLTRPKPDLSSLQQIRSFVISLIAFVCLVVLGYSSIYHICHHQSGLTAFTGIPGDGYDFFYFIYYSVVTFATVGYGDIYPAGLGTTPICDEIWMRILTRALVGSEICMSFIVVAVFIASFSLAFGSDAD